MKAVRLRPLHSCVEQLAKQFAEATLTKCPATCSQPGTTHREKGRVQRARNRVEIYYNPFHNTNEGLSSIYPDQRELFMTL